MEKSITILGITGHVGAAAARAFVAAGWHVTGMGRTNKNPIKGVTFVKGDAQNISDIRKAVGDNKTVFNGLNLKYDEWDEGRMEALNTKVIEALQDRYITMLFPGNIYNFAASEAEIYTDTPQYPQTQRGAIRVRQERQLQDAAQSGKMQVIILRAGDFYGPDSGGNDWYDLFLLREASKYKLAIPGPAYVGHAWAYLPDLGRAFEKLASQKASLAAFEVFHFEGHFETHEALRKAIQKAAPSPLKVVNPPWTILKVIGLFDGVIREVLKMRYLWDTSMALRDPRLTALLGPEFDTPFEAAVAHTVTPFFEDALKKAA